MHRRQLPLAFACSRNLADMPTRADGRERWCESCERRVHDLSQLSELEALALLRRADGLCVAFAFDEREQVVFRRTRLDRVGVALASLALLLSAGCSGLVQLDVTIDPGCASVQSRDMTPIDPAARFELPEREAARDVTIWMGEMDEVEDLALLPRSVGLRTAHGGYRPLIQDIDPLHELVALSERAPPPATTRTAARRRAR